MFIPDATNAPAVVTATCMAHELGYASLTEAISDLRETLSVAEVADVLGIAYTTLHGWLIRQPPAPPPMRAWPPPPQPFCQTLSPWRDHSDAAPKPSIWLERRNGDYTIVGPGATAYLSGSVV